MGGRFRGAVRGSQRFVFWLYSYHSVPADHVILQAPLQATQTKTGGDAQRLSTCIYAHAPHASASRVSGNADSYACMEHPRKIL